MNANYNLLGYNIYRLLKQYAGPEHPLKQKEILEILADVYRMEPARGTLISTIHDLVNAGCPIMGLQGRKGIWLAPEFSDLELKLLIGPLVTANYLSAKNINKLLKKMAILDRSIKFAKAQGFRTNKFFHTEGDVFETLRIIEQAEHNHQKLIFTYCDLDEHKHYIPRTDAAHPKGRREVSVYGFICSDNHYYMVAKEQEPFLRNFRVDKMTNLLITGQKAEEISTIPGHEKDRHLDLAEYIAQMNYKMFSGDDIDCRIRITVPDPTLRTYYINTMWDEFGNRPHAFRILDDCHFEFSITLSKWGAKVFAQQYCDIAEIIAPQNFRLELTAEFNKVAKDYSS